MVYLYKQSYYLWIALKTILLLLIIYNLFKMFSFSDLNGIETIAMFIQLIFIILTSIHILNSASDRKTNKVVRIITGIIEISSGILFIYLVNNHGTELISLAYIIALFVILIGLFDILSIERITEENNEEII